MMKIVFLILFVSFGVYAVAQDFDVYAQGEIAVYKNHHVRSKIETFSDKEDFIIHHYDTTGRLQSSFHCSYDVELLNSGFGTGEIVLGDTSILVSRKTFYHYENALLTFETEIYPLADGADTLTEIDTTISYTYNSMGLLTQVIKDNITSRYTYDDNGNGTQVQVYGLNEVDPSSSYDEINEYSKKGQRISTKTEDPSFPFEIYYTYNSKGNLTQEMRGFKNREQTPILYIYDKKGLLIERRIASESDWPPSQSIFYRYEFYTH